MNDIPTSPDDGEKTDLQTWPDAMRQDANGVRPALNSCSGFCHDAGDDDCSLCGSFDFDLMCDDCSFYLAQDAEVA